MSRRVIESLVNTIVKSKLSETLLKFSDTPDEQEGYANILRGIVGAFRNTSHHGFMENITREQALQVCAFIDNLLTAIELAEVRNQS